MLNGKHAEFLLSWETRQRRFIFPLLFIIVLEGIARAIQEGSKSDANKEVRLSLFKDSMVLHIIDPKDSTLNS